MKEWSPHFLKAVQLPLAASAFTTQSMMLDLYAVLALDLAELLEVNLTMKH